MLVLHFLSVLVTSVIANDIRPNIVYILIDDLGWNDVGFHGSSEFPTPNIDALAFSGLILNRHYVTPLCTPSRAALMTGKYPIHTGMQHSVIYGLEKRGLPLSEKLLPQYLKELGYRNHILGKWHLGHYQLRYSPLQRGFDSHVGYWLGHQNLFDHTCGMDSTWGYDMRRGYDVAYDLHGHYTTHVIGDESVKLIQNHNKSEPMFLYIAHGAVHSSNPYDFQPVPDKTVMELSHIEDYHRRKFAAMMVEVDNSIGALVEALANEGMLSNTIIVFSSDNGGPAAGFNSNYASNWPLRGVKNTLWEGGIRGASFIWSPLLEAKRQVSEQMIHITDWLPTLYEAAGGDPSILPTDLDGVSCWKQLIDGSSTDRHEVLHNIDDIWGWAALTVDEWKIIKGSTFLHNWDKWYGPAGNRAEVDYNILKVIRCPVAVALKDLKLLCKVSKMLKMRQEAVVHCNGDESSGIECDPMKEPCLFNIIDDPCEYRNLAHEYPDKLHELLTRLNDYNATALPPATVEIDVRGEPKNWNYTWSNFGDHLEL